MIFPPLVDFVVVAAALVEVVVSLADRAMVVVVAVAVIIGSVGVVVSLKGGAAVVVAVVTVVTGRVVFSVLPVVRAGVDEDPLLQATSRLVNSW